MSSEGGGFSYSVPQSQGGARVDFQGENTFDQNVNEERDSELDFEGDLEPMERLTDSDSKDEVAPENWKQSGGFRIGRTTRM